MNNEGDNESRDNPNNTGDVSDEEYFAYFRSRYMCVIIVNPRVTKKGEIRIVGII